MPYQEHEGNQQIRIFAAARLASPRETGDRRTWDAGPYVGDPWLTESRAHGENWRKNQTWGTRREYCLGSEKMRCLGLNLEKWSESVARYEKRAFV
jgi:hypothetical protein